MTPKEIIVTANCGEFMAADDRQRCFGRTPAEAVGKLILNNQAYYGVEVSETEKSGALEKITSTT